MCDDEEEITPLILAAIGTVLLVAAGGVTFVTGLLSQVVNYGCPEADYGAGEPAYCRNSEAVTRMLTVPVLLVVPAGLLFTWLRFTQPYRPRAWVPVVGLAVLGTLWFVADSLVDGRLF